MKKSQFSQFYSLIYAVLLVSGFSMFYLIINQWSEMNIVQNKFSDLKTIIYKVNNYGFNSSVFFNSSTNLTVSDNLLVFNSSGFIFRKKFTGIIMDNASILNAYEITVFKNNDMVKIYG